MENRQALYSIEQGDERRYYKALGGYTPDDILRISKGEKPYLTLMELGVQIREDEFATIQQSENFTFSVEMNFDADTARIYTVNGGVGGVDENDRTDNNVQIYEIGISGFPAEFNIGDVLRIPANVKIELPECYGVISEISKWHLGLEIYNIKDTAFCINSGYKAYNGNDKFARFVRDNGYNFVGTLEDLRQKDHEQNREIYDAIEKHEVVNIANLALNENSEYYGLNARNFRIEWNEIETEEIDRGFVLKADNKRGESPILICYGDISPEMMYLDMKLENFVVTEIGARKQEQADRESQENMDMQDKEVIIGDFINKVNIEYRNFIADMKTQPPERIIEAAYEITWKDSITQYIENENLRLSTKQLQALMSSNNSLDEIYEQWCQNGELHSYDDIQTALDDTANNIVLSLERSNDAELTAPPPRESDSIG